MKTYDEWVQSYREAFERCETADAAITVAIGAGSMCWEHVERAGVFESGQASLIAEALAAHLRDRRGMPH